MLGQERRGAAWRRFEHGQNYPVGVSGFTYSEETAAVEFDAGAPMHVGFGSKERPTVGVRTDTGS